MSSVECEPASASCEELTLRQAGEWDVGRRERVRGDSRGLKEARWRGRAEETTAR